MFRLRFETFALITFTAATIVQQSQGGFMFDVRTSINLQHNQVGPKSSTYNSRITPTYLQETPNEDDRDEGFKSEVQKGSNDISRRSFLSLGGVANVVQIIFTVFIQTFSAAVSFGFLLNLCGYGYRITDERSVEIDKLSNMRENAQFRAAAKAMKSDREITSVESRSDR